MNNDETFIVLNKVQAFIASLIFWFAGVVMLTAVLWIGKLWDWVFGS